MSGARARARAARARARGAFAPERSGSARGRLRFALRSACFGARDGRTVDGSAGGGVLADEARGHDLALAARHVGAGAATREVGARERVAAATRPTTSTATARRARPARPAARAARARRPADPAGGGARAHGERARPAPPRRAPLGLERVRGAGRAARPPAASESVAPPPACAEPSASRPPSIESTVSRPDGVSRTRSAELDHMEHARADEAAAVIADEDDASSGTPGYQQACLLIRGSIFMLFGLCNLYT